MKIKTTQKAIKENYSNILAVGYAEYYNLLDKYKADCYTSGGYGWNANIFLNDKTDTAIVTGYRTFGNRLSDEQLAIFKKYDNKAKKLKERFNDYIFSDKENTKNYSRYYNQMYYILDKMLQNAIKKVLKCK